MGIFLSERFGAFKRIMTDPFKPILPSVFAHRVGHDTERPPLAIFLLGRISCTMIQRAG